MRRDFTSLAVPDKLDLALVFEKNEAVFLRDRLVLIDELDEVALLSVGELIFSASCCRFITSLRIDFCSASPSP